MTEGNFVDYVKLHVSSGKGGKGSIHLHREKFITKGDKVKFTVKFRGREMQHTDLGKDLMNRIIEETKDIAKIESKPKFEGRQMVMIIQPI